MDRPQTHEPRPTPKTVLPFRFTTEPNGLMLLWWDVHYRDGQKGPSCMELGDPRTPLCNLVGTQALARGVWDLVQMYYALEKEMDGVRAQRDEAITELTVLKGQNRADEKSNHARDVEIERQRQAKRKT